VGQFRQSRRGGLPLGLGALVAILALGLIAIGAPERAASLTGADDPSRVAQVRVIDGDTIEDTATGERIRLANIDTAETGARAHCAAERRHGEAATLRARELMASASVSVQRSGRIDRYGRTIARVSADGRDVGVTLIDEGLARPWRGRREAWCGADGALLR
jgi:micrococcal nuclease